MDTLETDELADLSGLRVVVVDDDQDTRELIARLVAGQGADVQEAATGAAALAIVSSWCPDILVSDIGLRGGIDGYALIEHVRRLPATGGGRAGAIAVTGYTSVADVRRILAAGYDAYMAKPFDSVELTRTVAQVAAGLRRAP